MAEAVESGQENAAFPVEEETFQLAGLSETIFRDRYARTPTETWQEACRRVANHVAQVEENGKIQKYSDRFYQQLVTNRFNPGGRIWYGSGRPKAQLLNCFVVPTGDSREAWGKTASDVIVISGLMGGVGINLSPIRGRGFQIKGTGGVATGSVSYGQLINGVGNVIVGGGGRRMALMLALALNHPDVEEFLHVKLDLEELNNANISLIIPEDMPTERFQEMVRNREEIELEFNGVPTGKSVNAGWLWDKLVENAYRSGEPGVLNGYLANQMNNIWYHKPLICTNPCVTGDTWVHTSTGPMRVNDLVGKPWSLVVDGKAVVSTGFFKTGTKPVYTLQTAEGYNLNLTVDHPVLREDGKWVEAGSLEVGDRIVLNNHSSFTHWNGEGGSFDEGYVTGHFLGDGTWAHKPRLCSWGDSLGEAAVRQYIEEITEQEWRFTGVNYVMHNTTPAEWLEMGEKVVSDSVQKASSEFQRGFLRGLFDTDGHVEGASIEGGISIRLSQSNLDVLHDVQRMLLRFGIRSKINLAREACLRDMPDGKGALRPYEVKTQWRLIISSDCERFMQMIGFQNYDKSAKYREAHSKMSRGFYRKAFVATVSGFEYIGERDVYDVQVPNLNAFDANGLYVHNCGEIWLEAYGCCDLGALVLPRFVADGEFDWDALDETIRLAIRFLDNVLSVNHYPLTEIKENCEQVRRIGMGVMGLHTMLLEMGMRYDSDEAFRFVDQLFGTIKNTAYDASINLAIEKGPFPAYDPRFLEGQFVQSLKRGIRNKIKEHGIRNCALMTIAPTGTTSLVAGVSSGIEPIPAPVYKRNYFKPTEDGRRVLNSELVVEEAFHKYSPDILQSAIDVPVWAHFEMQKIVQKHIDNAVSKTINMAEDASMEEFGKIWLEYLPYCKGTTVYRFGSRENEPINPIPRDQWEEVVGSGVVHDQMTVDEFMGLDCAGGVCEVPQKWQEEVVAV